ncbi:MAG TPA: hypothetical protein H9913_04680 [Candidatus Blautia stercoripullorum]|mgnify:FL=1|uniref:ABC transporter domain-containing protein n=1 Tax=Candidatus Blautia stercoripullorum TaxID=2838502 RepID=A0A9D2U495_9FIRM|nr:hypothetical protein [Candidatus Blautia stercoripullorum]
MDRGIYSTGNTIVDENAKLNISGNVIPQSWYRTMVRDSGKPHLTAIIILADEPTGNLDSENGKIVLDILKDLVRRENYCVVIVTHDLDIAAQADVVYVMKDGRLTERRGEKP